MGCLGTLLLLYNDFVDLFVENLMNSEYPYIKDFQNRLEVPYKWELVPFTYDIYSAMNTV